MPLWDASQPVEHTALTRHAIGCLQINLRDDTDEIQDYLKELTGGRSVPRVSVISVLPASSFFSF